MLARINEANPGGQGSRVDASCGRAARRRQVLKKRTQRRAATGDLQNKPNAGMVEARFGKGIHNFGITRAGWVWLDWNG
jgi:hypothetical protein